MGLKVNITNVHLGAVVRSGKEGSLPYTMRDGGSTIIPELNLTTTSTTSSTTTTTS